MNPPQVLPGKSVLWLRNLISYPGIHFFHFLHHTTNNCMVEAFSDHLLWLYLPFFIWIKHCLEITKEKKPWIPKASPSQKD